MGGVLVWSGLRRERLYTWWERCPRVFPDLGGQEQQCPRETPPCSIYPRSSKEEAPGATPAQLVLMETSVFRDQLAFTLFIHFALLWSLVLSLWPQLGLREEALGSMRGSWDSHEVTDLHWRWWHSNSSSLSPWPMPRCHNDLPTDLGYSLTPLHSCLALRRSAPRLDNL